MGNQGNPGNQNQRKPTGTSGRESGNDTGGNPDIRRDDRTTSTGGSRRVHDDDEESGGLGNRTTNR